MKNLLSVLSGVLGVLAVLVGNGFAALTAPTIATTDIDTMAAAVVAFLAVVWAINIAIGFFRRR